LHVVLCLFVIFLHFSGKKDTNNKRSKKTKEKDMGEKDMREKQKEK